MQALLNVNGRPDDPIGLALQKEGYVAKLLNGIIVITAQENVVSTRGELLFETLHHLRKDGIGQVRDDDAYGHGRMFFTESIKASIGNVAHFKGGFVYASTEVVADSVKASKRARDGHFGNTRFACQVL